MKALSEDITPDPVALMTARAQHEGTRHVLTVGKSTREGMKKLLTPVTPELHKRLKMMAVRDDTTLEALTRTALEFYLSTHDSN
jgi:hypothetical protein